MKARFSLRHFAGISGHVMLLIGCNELDEKSIQEIGLLSQAGVYIVCSPLNT